MLGVFHSCSGTLENLMDESGCALEHPKAAKFRSHVLSGEWEQVHRDTSQTPPEIHVRTPHSSGRILSP